MAPRIHFVVFDNTKYFPALDGMRALSVLLVMFNHAHVTTPSWILGWLGVDVFFVLSGFLITTLLLRERDHSGRVSLRAFYTRRFFRIIPVYLFTVLLYVAAVYAIHDPVKTAQLKSALPCLLTFMQEYRPESAGNILGHSWTLGIEEKFYFFWPLVLIVLFPFRRWAVVWLGALFAVALTFSHMYARSYGGLLIGAMLAIALSAPAQWRFVERLPAVPDALLVLLIAAMYALTRYNDKFVLLFSASVALLIASLVLRAGWLRTFFENRMLVYIGKRSYAMYLIHVLVINAVTMIPLRFLPQNWVLVVGVSYAICVACASLLHVTIEQRCMAVGRRLSKRFAELPHAPLAAARG